MDRSSLPRSLWRVLGVQLGLRLLDPRDLGERGAERVGVAQLALSAVSPWISASTALPVWSAFPARIWLQRSGSTPPTRVRSRHEPAATSGVSIVSLRPTSAAATRCGRCERTATWRSCSAAAIRTGVAPISLISAVIRSRTSRLVLFVGVRIQRAPRNIHAEAYAGPLFSCPAIGCPPMRRSARGGPCASAQSRSAPLTLVQSVSAVSGPRCGASAASVAFTWAGGTATKTASAARDGLQRGLLVEAVALDRLGDVLGARVAPDHPVRGPLERHPDRAADEPDAYDPDRHRALF